MNIFAIGDIHGCLNQLISIHNKIFNYPNYKKEEDLLIYIGDYIDRGPKSNQVIDEILQLKNKEINFKNRTRMLDVYRDWYEMENTSTLEEFV